MGVVSFAAAILAGAGIDALRAGKGSPTPWLAMAILCAGIWLGLRTEAASAWTAIHFGASESLAGEMTGSADRKSTRLNSSHSSISYAVFCLKKKTTPNSKE